MALLWVESLRGFNEFRKGSSIRLWDFYGISMGLLWVLLTMDLLWVYYGISMGFLWDESGSVKR